MREKISRFLKGQMATSVILYSARALLLYVCLWDMVNILCKFIFGRGADRRGTLPYLALLYRRSPTRRSWICFPED